MKYLLVAINSQYIHTNLAVRYLKKYVEAHSNKKIEVYETNINNQIMNIIRDIYEAAPDVVIFSTYIWNRDVTFRVIKELAKITNAKIGLGGPEVTYNSKRVLEENSEVDFLITGEGERGLLKVMNEEIDKLSGIYMEEMPNNLDEIPFPYSKEELMTERKILYYESSRGCPFSCSYCLSSIERGLKVFSLDRVKSDLKIFLDSNVRLIKFVDRTFNINKGRYLEIWKYLIDNYREGITFHFEINANILDEESLNLLKNAKDGYFQFEIGIQTTNIQTMESINRRNLLEKLSDNIRKIPREIHLHLDLIAGLPYETYELFQNSFNYVYNLKPEMVQLGFLKLLEGTKISREIELHQYKFTEFAPYEVVSNKYITFGELSKLKEFEKILDYYYNSEKFQKSVDFIISNFYLSPFKFFEEVAEYFKEKALIDIGHKDLSLFNYLIDFFKMKKFQGENFFIEYLKYDFLKLGKPGVYPSWFISRKDSETYDRILKTMKFVSIREGHRFSEVEVFDFNVEVVHSIEELKNISKEEVVLFFNYKDKKVERICKY